MINLPPLQQKKLGKYNPFGLAFRPFFLLTGFWAIISILLWTLHLQGVHNITFYTDAFLWHRHEMLIGMGSALAAGFLLTAVRNWTNLPMPQGKLLAGMAFTWLAARLLWLSGDLISPWIILLVDAVFLPWFLYEISKPIIQRKQWQQWPFPSVIIGLWLGNISMHLGYITGLAEWIVFGEKLAIYALLGLILVMAGRITPFFTERGCDIRLTPTPDWLVNSRVVGYVIIALLDISHSLIPAWIGSFSLLFSLIALITAGLLWLQLYYWQTWRTFHNPLVWVLHLGYFGFGLGFLLLAISTIEAQWQSAAYHAWLALAMGGVGLGMMSRVSLGHSGHTLSVLPGIKAAFTLAILAGLTRSFAPLNDHLIWISALLWMSAFSLFWFRYLPIWLKTRPDGMPD